MHNSLTTRTREMMFRGLLCSFVIGLSVLLGGGDASAQTNWLTAGAGPFNFNNAANWSAGVPLQGVTGVFPAGFPGMPAMITLNANTTVGGLTFNDPVDGTIGVAGGSVLTLNNNGAGATVAFNAQNAAGWTVQPNITLGDNAIFNVANGVNGTITGNIGGPAGNSVTVGGQGVLTLTGTNSYTGTTIVNGGGTLQINAAGNPANGFIGSKTFNVSNASTLRLMANNTDEIDDAAAINLTGGSTFDLNNTFDVIGSLSGDATSMVTFGAAGPPGTQSLRTGASSSTTFAGVISGVGGLTKNGAGTTFTLSGNNTYTGPTRVDAGRLNINGNGSSAVTVNNGATFGGTGAVPSVTVNNGGTIAPGNSIGTMTITGGGTPAFTQVAGSTYQAEINNTGTVPGINNDLISLTNAAATAALAGTVNVIDTTAGGFYAAGTTYTVLTTANPNGVTGTYGAVTTPGSLAATRVAMLIHNPNSVQVQLQRIPGNYAMNAVTPNQRHVGTVLDGVNALATGDLGTVLDQMVQLPNANKPAILDQLSGELHASVAGNVVQTTSRFVDMVSRRLRTNSPGASGIYGATVVSNPPTLGGVQQVNLSNGGDFVVRAQGLGAPGYGYGYGGLTPFPSASAVLGGTWASGYGVKGDVDGDGNGGPYDYTLAGTAFGIEQNLTPILLVGLVGGYSNTDFDMNRPRSSADVDSYRAGVYAHVTEGIAYSSSLLSVGYQDYDTRRRIMIPGPMPIARTARADYKGQDLTAYIEKGLNLSMGGLRVQPLVGLQYLGLKRDAFTETGAGALNLTVNEDHVDSLRFSAGGRIAPEIPPGFFGAILPEIRGRWVHEFLDDDQALSASFAGAPGANFIVNSAELGRNFGVIGAGLNAQISPMARLFIDYDYTFSSSLESHAGSGGVELLW